MKIFTLNDGTKIRAKSARDLVTQMRKLVSSHNEQTFMREVAERATLQDHTAKIPTDRPDRFVDALIKVGFIKAIDDDE